MMLNCHTENKVKRPSHFEKIVCYKTKQYDWPRGFLDQNSRITLLNYLKWLNQFVASICNPYTRNQYHSSIQSWHIPNSGLRTISDMQRWAWQHQYEWNESNKWFYVCLTSCKKSFSYLRSFFEIIADSPFWITLAMPDHTHLKWLNEFWTSTDA